MNDIDELMKLYKEIQENYIKALERENAELRDQREKDSLKIEELEKKLIEESTKQRYTPVTSPTIPYDQIIGPGVGTGIGGWGHPNTFPGIGINDNTIKWNENKWTSNPVVISTGGTASQTSAGGYIASTDSLNKVIEAKKAYDMLKDTMKTIKTTSNSPDADNLNSTFSYMEKMRQYFNHKENKNDN
jgi:hypothetical protein